MKRTIRENYRLEMRPSYPWTRNEQRLIEDLKETIQLALRSKAPEDVERLMDELECSDIEVAYDEKDICGFCGTKWEVQPEDGNPDIPLGQPLCCEKAVEEFNLQLAGKIEDES